MPVEGGVASRGTALLERAEGTMERREAR